VRARAAVDAVEQLEFLESVIVGKAAKPPSILSDDGFLRSIFRASRRLVQNAVATVDSRRFVERLRASTDVDWRGAPAKDRDRAVEETAKLLRGVPSEIMPGARVVLDETAGKVVKETRKELGKKHKELRVDAVFQQRDERAIEALGSSSAVFFMPEYERRARGFRSRAQKIIAAGLEAGYGRREIAADLRAEFRETAIAETYWETAASVHVSRARSFSSAATYAEAGVESYRWVAIKDSRTTPLCAALDGMVFTVKGALDAFDRLEDAEDLEDVKRRLSPFGRVLSDGQIELSSGELLDPDATAEDFEAAGIHMPPAHHRCRSTVVPEL
jgi:SPP1 gp7 family putative phage head morphogenesis protein